MTTVNAANLAGQDFIAALSLCNEKTLLLIQQLLGLQPALHGLSSEMLKRRITGGYDADSEFFVAHLSPVLFRVFEKELKLMKAASYVAWDVTNWDGHTCHTCGSSKGAYTTYYVKLPDGTVDRKSYRSFDICVSCCHVTEDITINYHIEAIPQAAKEAVTAPTEGQLTIERIAPVQRDTSSVDQTAPMPSLTSTTSSLYATGEK